jgi:hypothetical protein
VKVPHYLPKIVVVATTKQTCRKTIGRVFRREMTLSIKSGFWLRQGSGKFRTKAFLSATRERNRVNGGSDDHFDVAK